MGHGAFAVKGRIQELVKQVLLGVGRDLFEEALPGFLVSAETSFEVFEDALEVSVGAEIVPGGVLLKPGVVFVS